MSLVLDAGALLAVERGHRHVLALLKGELMARRVPITHGGVVGQAWRGGGARQALLSRCLSAVVVHPLDDALGRRAGALLARSGSADVVDAALVLLARDDDTLLTSDPADLAALAAAAGVHVTIVQL